MPVVKRPEIKRPVVKRPEIKRPVVKRPKVNILSHFILWTSNMSIFGP